MTKVAELQSCDGFAVEGPDGALGWVEETWLDSADHAGALAVRTADGRRALLLAESVVAVDLDAQQVLVTGGEPLLGLDAPRLEDGGRLVASWSTTGAVVEPAPQDDEPSPAIAAARAASAPRDRPPLLYVLLALGSLAGLVALEIGLAFGIAYLVTGHAY
jgi:hypothetical protein